MLPIHFFYLELADGYDCQTHQLIHYRFYWDLTCTGEGL